MSAADTTELESGATMSELDLEKLLARTLQEPARARLTALTQTIARNPRSTIEPEGARSDALGRVALAELGEAGAAHDVGASVVVEGTLGEGGMGIVRLATQRSLGRKVAVKTLRPDVRSEQAALRLLREAWVTGSLEHPNIVPVYDLGLSADGAPVIVLKRIEGDAWSSLIRDGAEVQKRFGNTDLLEHNLRILVQVCNAVALAHARGILHRDLKPENVMIGSFGEVYLVDWGVAVTLRSDPTGRLPPSPSEGDLAGTPVYMAPEMLGNGAPLGPRTDVYLLGAILHEILTGRPPHDEGNFRAIVASILRFSPTYPDDAPRELVAIAKKAMAYDAAERFGSVDELRARLEWYLRHRGSLALSEEAAKSLAELRRNADAPLDAKTREQIYRLFAEARFGFRQALVASPDNEDARDGLRAASEIVIAWELANGTADGAAAALAQLEDAPPDIAARVAEAQRTQQARAARLTALERDLDPAVGRRTRVFVSLLLGLLWTVIPLVMWRFQDRVGWGRPRLMYGFTISQVALTYALTTWARESLQKSLVNRRVIASARMMFAWQLALELIVVLAAVPYQTSFVLHLFVWFASAASFALFVEPRMWPSAGGYLVGTILAALFPAWAWPIASITNAVLMMNAMWAWRARGDLADLVRTRRAARRARRP